MARGARYCPGLNCCADTDIRHLLAVQFRSIGKEFLYSHQGSDDDHKGENEPDGDQDSLLFLMTTHADLCCEKDEMTIVVKMKI